MCRCNCFQLWQFNIRNIFWHFITFRTFRRTNWAESYHFNTMRSAIIKQLRLLEAWMKLHLDRSWFNSAKWKYCLQFRDCHIRHTDMFRQTHIYQALHLAPGFHKALYCKRFGIRISGIHITMWCMIVREWPVNIIHIQIVKLQIL